MLIFPAAFLLLLFAFFSASALRVSGRPFYLLAVYLLACTADVLVFEIAGLLRWLGNPALFLALQAALTLAAGGIWYHSGHPYLLGPFAEDVKRLDFSRLGPSMRRHPALWLLTLAVDLAYSVNAYLILVVPPNNNDSLYLHMARVVRWLQTGSFLPYPTNFSWQIFYAFNAQSLIHWTVLFWDSDQLAGFVQFSAALVSMLCVYILARQLHFSRPQGIFAALVWATFPQVFLQSTTTQNDLVPAAFFAGALVFLVQGFRSADRRPGLVLSALGLGLALGAKQTVFFLLPGLACMILLLARQQHSRGWAFLTRWIPAAALAFSLVGALVYFENNLYFGNPLGETKSVAQVFRAPLGGLSANLQPAEISVPGALWINLNRIGYQFVDTTGLPPLIEGYLFRGKARLARLICSLVDCPLESSVAANPNTLVQFDFFHRPPIQEDETWFGILAPFLMIPAGLVTLARSVPRKDPLPIGLWLVAISFVLLELLLRPGWDAYLGRNFSLAVVVLAPFMAAAYHPGRLQIGVWIITALAVYALITLTLNNTAKPLVGQKAIWILNRSEKVTLENYQLKEPAQLVEDNVPPDAVLALPGGTWEYPFYDVHFHRRLIQVTAPEMYRDAAWLHDQGVTYLLVRNEKSTEIDTTLERLAAGEEWTIYRLP